MTTLIQADILDAVKNHGPWKLARLYTYLGHKHHEVDLKNAALRLIMTNRLEWTADRYVTLPKE